MAKATRRSRTRGRPVSKSVRRSRGRPASKSRSRVGSRSTSRSRGRSNKKKRVKRHSRMIKGGAEHIYDPADDKSIVNIVNERTMKYSATGKSVSELIKYLFENIKNSIDCTLIFDISKIPNVGILHDTKINTPSIKPSTTEDGFHNLKLDLGIYPTVLELSIPTTIDEQTQTITVFYGLKHNDIPQGDYALQSNIINTDTSKLQQNISFLKQQIALNKVVVDPSRNTKVQAPGDPFSGKKGDYIEETIQTNKGENKMWLYKDRCIDPISAYIVYTLDENPDKFYKIQYDSILTINLSGITN